MKSSRSENTGGGGFRQLKRRIEPWLRRPDPAALLDDVRALPARQVVNPLISFFYHPEPIVRWRAISAVGAVTAALAETEPESARVIMRRLMWHLNDESGGIGWGAPEAMADAMARSPRLAAEFHRILVSYILPDGNFLEHGLLQHGVLWAVGRLAETRPPLVAGAADALAPFLSSADPVHRGLAARAAGLIGPGNLAAAIEALTEDPARVPLYVDLHLHEVEVGELAREALVQLRIQSDES